MLRISLLGRFRAEWEGRKVSGLGSGKVEELFCYLLLHRNRFHPREFLAELIWPEHSSAQSRKYLRQALWQLQSALNLPNMSSDNQLLVVEHSFVSINMESCFWLDVVALERAFVAVQDVRGHELDEESAGPLKDAVQLYRADLLDGWYQDWCVSARERLRSIYLIMLNKLMEYCEAYQEYEAGITYGHGILCYEPAHERTHRKLMRLYYLWGDRTAALRQYERCVVILDRELNVRPAPGTTALYEQIRNGRLLDGGSGSGLPNKKLPQSSRRMIRVASASK